MPASIVEAVGTQFNVRLRQDDALVSVIEGAVRVSSSAAAGQAQPSVELEAGLQVAVDRSGQLARPEAADLKRVEAWRQRRLIFVDAPLLDIANEFNRYNRAPRIVVEGEAAGTSRYAAAFDADDPESLLEILMYDPELRVERKNEEILIRGR